MKTSFAILRTTLIILFIVESVKCFVFDVILHNCTSTHAPVVYVIFIVVIISGIDLFKANAIQFGMDLLLEPSSNQLARSFGSLVFLFLHTCI